MLPSDASLTWQIMDSSIEGEECFSITDLGITDSEKGTGQIEIRGIEETKGSVPVTFMNSYGKTAQINIKIAWNYDFSLTRTPKIDGKPEGTYKIGYTVCPGNSVFQGLDDWSCASVSEVVTAKTDEKREGYFEITPKTETASSGETHTITAVNPSDKNATVGEQDITLKFGYEKLKVTASKYESDGNFSEVNNGANTIVLSDGETLKVKFDIPGAGAKSYVETAAFSKDGYLWTCDPKDKTIWTLKETVPNDVIEEGYEIEWAQTPTDKSIDWEKDFKWHFSKCGHADSKDDLWLALVPAAFTSGTKCISRNYYLSSSGVFMVEYADSAHLKTTFQYYAIAFRNPFDPRVSSKNPHVSSKTCPVWHGGYTYDNTENVLDWTVDKDSYPVEENKSLEGQFWSKQRFESCAWFYCPGTSATVSALEVSSIARKTSESKNATLEWADGTLVTDSAGQYYACGLGGGSKNRSVDCAPRVNGGAYMKDLSADGRKFCIKEQVFSKNVRAKETKCTDKSVADEQQLGTCAVTVYNAYTGARETAYYNIYFETHNCSMTQK